MLEEEEVEDLQVGLLEQVVELQEQTIVMLEIQELLILEVEQVVEVLEVDHLKQEQPAVQES
jgi:hypothetical protein